MPINENILDQAFEVFAKAQKKIGAPVPDEVSFVGGFVTMYGIMRGRVLVPGADRDAPLTEILDIIDRNIHEFGRRVALNQVKQGLNGG